MVLRNSGRVGSRHLLKRHLSSQKLTWVPLLFLLHHCCIYSLWVSFVARIYASFIYLFSSRSSFPQSYLLYMYLCSCSPRAFIFSAYYLLVVLFSWRTIFWAYYFLVVLSSGQIYCLHVSMLCPPPCTYLLFTLGRSGWLSFWFVPPLYLTCLVFFLILLPLLSISFLLAFLLRCTCRKLIDFPLYDMGLSYSLRLRKCLCFLAKLLPE